VLPLPYEAGTSPAATGERGREALPSRPLIWRGTGPVLPGFSSGSGSCLTLTLTLSRRGRGDMESMQGKDWSSLPWREGVRGRGNIAFGHQPLTPVTIAALTAEKRARETYHLTLVLVASLVSSEPMRSAWSPSGLVRPQRAPSPIWKA